MCIDWLTEITGWPVCLATRSAVRCRVPDSSVGIVGSGIRCTAARTIRVPSLERTTAPSILHSSRSRVAENSTSSGKPPVHNDSTALSWPSTISAPVRPRRIRSSPSRSTVPGATRASVARKRALPVDRHAAQSTDRDCRARPAQRIAVAEPPATVSVPCVAPPGDECRRQGTCLAVARDRIVWKRGRPPRARPAGLDRRSARLAAGAAWLLFGERAGRLPTAA